jgi:Family of unknown function (DUF6171)
MDWKECLEIVVKSTKCEDWRKKCDASHPQHELWRQRVLARVEKREYPPVTQQVGNAVKAGLRYVFSGGAKVTDEVYAERLDICHACEWFDAKQNRCKKCGCVANWKARLATEHCPVQKW